jgi:outer membrane protein, heavy metal efflux system
MISTHRPHWIVAARCLTLVALALVLAPAVGCHRGTGFGRLRPTAHAGLCQAAHPAPDFRTSYDSILPKPARLDNADGGIVLTSLVVREAGSNTTTGDPPQSDPAPLPPDDDSVLDAGAVFEQVAVPEDWPELTFDQAIAACLQNDPVLRAGFEEILLADADQVSASLRPNPEVEIIQSLLPLTRPFIADEREGGPPQFDLAVSYPIDWYLFGKRAAEMRSAAAEVHVSQAEYADLVRQRVLEAALAYYDVMEAQALVDLAQQDSENLMLVEQITEIAVDNGAMPRVELNRIRLDRLNSQQTLREAQRDLRIAKAQLRALMGGIVPIGVRHFDQFRVTDQLTDAVEERQHPERLDDVEYLVAIAESQRPDIQALQRRIVQSQMEIEVQCREAYPEVTPMLGYTRQFQRRAIGFPDADSWGVGVAFTLPIYNRNQGNRLRAEAQWRQSARELEGGLVELRAEVTSVVAELETASINAAAVAEDQLRLAEEVRDSIRQAYEAGGRPLIDVLDSQRNYRETYENYINSRVDYLRAAQRFRAVLGGQRYDLHEPDF